MRIMSFTFLVGLAVFVLLSCIWKIIKLVAMVKMEEQVEELESLQAERKANLMLNNDFELDNRSRAIFQRCGVFMSPKEARSLRRLSILAGLDRKWSRSSSASGNRLEACISSFSIHVVRAVNVIRRLVRWPPGGQAADGDGANGTKNNTNNETDVESTTGCDPSALINKQLPPEDKHRGGGSPSRRTLQNGGIYNYNGHHRQFTVPVQCSFPPPLDGGMGDHRYKGEVTCQPVPPPHHASCIVISPSPVHGGGGGEEGVGAHFQNCAIHGLIQQQQEAALTATHNRRFGCLGFRSRSSQTLGRGGRRKLPVKPGAADRNSMDDELGSPTIPPPPPPPNTSMDDDDDDDREDEAKEEFEEEVFDAGDDYDDDEEEDEEDDDLENISRVESPPPGGGCGGGVGQETTHHFHHHHAAAAAATQSQPLYEIPTYHDYTSARSETGSRPSLSCVNPNHYHHFYHQFTPVTLITTTGPAGHTRQIVVQPNLHPAQQHQSSTVAPPPPTNTQQHMHHQCCTVCNQALVRALSQPNVVHSTYESGGGGVRPPPPGGTGPGYRYEEVSRRSSTLTRGQQYQPHHFRNKQDHDVDDDDDEEEEEEEEQDDVGDHYDVDGGGEEEEEEANDETDEKQDESGMEEVPRPMGKLRTEGLASVSGGGSKSEDHYGQRQLASSPPPPPPPPPPPQVTSSRFKVAGQGHPLAERRKSSAVSTSSSYHPPPPPGSVPPPPAPPPSVASIATVTAGGGGGAAASSSCGQPPTPLGLKPMTSVHWDENESDSRTNNSPHNTEDSP